MCPGTATKLLCQHYLVHWSGPRCPKRCVLPEHRTFLPCTCAPCDPAFNQRQIQAKYDAEREELSAQVREAMMSGGAQGGSSNNAASVRRVLERRLHLLLVDQMAELGRTRVRGLDPAVGCRWPGMYEQWVAENLGVAIDWDELLNS